MKFVIIAICLCLKILYPKLNDTFSYKCGMKYIHKMKESFHLTDSVSSVLLLVLPFFIIASVLFYVPYQRTLYFIQGLLSILVLYACLGPYLLRTSQEGESPSLPVEAFFDRFHTDWFAPLFFYVLLGLPFSVCYSMIAWLAQRSNSFESAENEWIASAAYLKSWFDWLPARVIGILYLFAGDLSQGFSHWIRYVFSGIGKNQSLICQGGLKAIGMNEDVLTSMNEESVVRAQSLLTRVLAIFLFSLILFLLGAWLF